MASKFDRLVFTDNVVHCSYMICVLDVNVFEIIIT